jgi:hypothetical protein
MRGARGLISLLLTLAVMVACSGQDKAVMNGETLTAQKQQQVLLRKRVAALLEKGSYRRALELMGGKNHPGHPAVGMEREYITAINGLLGAGEESFSRGDYAAAGQSFKCVLDSYPVDPVLRVRVRLEPKQVRAHLEACSNRMMEQGLQEYRRGNLESAIRKWKELIAFNAGDKEARKAIETATVQLRALQNMGNRAQ